MSDLHVSVMLSFCLTVCTFLDPFTMELEESMLFAINGDGATKIVNRKSWGKYVRRIKEA